MRSATLFSTAGSVKKEIDNTKYFTLGTPIIIQEVRENSPQEIVDSFSLVNLKDDFSLCLFKDKTHAALYSYYLQERLSNSNEEVVQPAIFTVLYLGNLAEKTPIIQRICLDKNHDSILARGFDIQFYEVTRKDVVPLKARLKIDAHIDWKIDYNDVAVRVPMCRIL